MNIPIDKSICGSGHCPMFHTVQRAGRVDTYRQRGTWVDVCMAGKTSINDAVPMYKVKTIPEGCVLRTEHTQLWIEDETRRILDED